MSDSTKKIRAMSKKINDVANLKDLQEEVVKLRSRKESARKLLRLYDDLWDHWEFLLNIDALGDCIVRTRILQHYPTREEVVWLKSYVVSELEKSVDNIVQGSKLYCAR